MAVDKGSLLIVDDNKNALKALRLFLQYEFECVKTLSNPNLIPSELQKVDYDVVLLDMNFVAGQNTGNEGFFWLNEIKKLSPLTEVVMFTAYGDVELAVRAVKEGAADFILKPWDNDKMVATLKSALRIRQSQLEVRNLKKKQQGLRQELQKEGKFIAGTSPQMLRVIQLISKIAPTDANILITGENGTGKEVIAREIHRLSARNNEIMVTVDIGSIPETLFESELFGHKKGAFTDAHEDRAGKFELAHKGTLFMDEIGNIPLNLQAKLLVAIQNRRVVPIGSNKEVEANIRLICATNANLEEMVANSGFREDLYYRINTIHIEIPPLRERYEDLEMLSNYFINKYSKRYNKPGLRLGSNVLKIMKSYHWPGNIRELEHTIEKAVILAESSVIKSEDILFKPIGRIKAHNVSTLEDMEKQMILAALEKQNGNYSSAAEQLGITRQTMYNKIKKYGL